MNLIEIETLRTKEELVNYFKEMGQNITEEEIETLKKSYEETENTAGVLTLEQLDEVAGGVEFFVSLIKGGNFKLTHIIPEPEERIVINLKQDGKNRRFVLENHDPFAKRQFRNALNPGWTNDCHLELLDTDGNEYNSLDRQRLLAAVLEQGFAVDPSFLNDRSKGKNVSKILSNAIEIEYNGYDGHGDKYVIYSLSTDSSLLNDNAAGEDHKCLIM